MLISTVIPTVGRASLGHAVDSALAQGFAADEHEVIVVNDSGAPLPAAAWMESDRVRILVTERRERSIARNSGAAVARGRYLHFLDDDDVLLPGGLRALLEIAEETGAVWTYGALQRVDDAGHDGSVDAPDVTGNVYVDVLAGNAFHLAPSLIRAEAFFRVGGFDPQYVVCEDRDLGARLAFDGAFEGTQRTVARVRVGPGNTTTPWHRMAESSRRVREAMLNRHGACARILDAAGSSPFLRGLAVRAYGASAVQQTKAARLAVAGSRIAPILRLSIPCVLRREFWLGLRWRHGTAGRTPEPRRRGAG